MENEILPSPIQTPSKVLISRQTVILFSIVLFAIMLLVGAIYFITISNKTSDTEDTPSTNQSTQNSPVRSNTDFLLSPANSGVTKAVVYYTLLGELQSIAQSSDRYIITVSSQTGETLLSSFSLKSEGVSVHEVGVDEKITPITFDDLQAGDLIEINMSGNLKTNAYEATIIYKYIKK